VLILALLHFCKATLIDWNFLTWPVVPSEQECYLAFFLIFMYVSLDWLLCSYEFQVLFTYLASWDQVLTCDNKNVYDWSVSLPLSLSAYDYGEPNKNLTKMFMNNQQMHWFCSSLLLLFCCCYMLRHARTHTHTRAIIRELFHAWWVTYKSNTMVDKTLRYTWLCVCYVEAWYALICLVTLSSAYALGDVTRHTRPPLNRHITMYNAESYQPLHSIRM
jgi:hypothetical protein